MSSHEATNNRTSHCAIRIAFLFFSTLMCCEGFPLTGEAQEASNPGRAPLQDGAESNAAWTILPAAYQAEDALDGVKKPAAPFASSNVDPNGNNAKKNNTDKTGDSIQSALLGGIDKVGELEEGRRARALSPGVDAVIGTEARLRETTDTGNLIGKSISVRGVSNQQRTPIVTDTRIRGERVGQVLAAGSFWAPARMDLDTMMSKIDSRLIGSLIIIKGPYSPRYGPGFSFVDIDMLSTPRFEDGFEMHGTTSADYQSNGQQWYGRQTFMGGDKDWGFRVSYGHRAGSDYETGAGFTIPSSYKSGDLNVAIGRNFTPDDRVEFNYLRLDQSDVEFPGLVYDLDYLGTEGYEVKYTGTSGIFADLIASEVWYNRTRFHGNTFRQSKQDQIPQLEMLLYSPSGVDGRAITNGYGSSFGYRNELTYGTVGVDHWSIGTDFILQKQGLNDIEIFAPPDDNNYPLPNSNSADVGFFIERVMQPNDWLSINMGGRADVMQTNSQDIVAGVPTSMTDIKDAELAQSFMLWNTYLSNEITLTDHWATTGGLAFAQRPPTLTELYVNDAFIGSLQRGLTFLDGDPELAPEKLYQIDWGLKGKYERFQGGVHAYHAWIQDYITYDLKTEPAASNDGLGTGAVFVNTDLAILRGVETYGRFQWIDSIALFGMLSYTEGDDLSREKAARQWTDPRSSVAGVPHEPLPGIAPLDSRLGLLWHDWSPAQKWGVEFSTRMVARQNRVATTLSEIETPGFATLDLRSYRRINKRNMLTAGVENLTNRFYREHLDYRSGFGVYRPGINFYTGLELNY